MRNDNKCIVRNGYTVSSSSPQSGTVLNKVTETGPSFISKYSAACFKQAPLGYSKCACLRQVLT